MFIRIESVNGEIKLEEIEAPFPSVRGIAAKRTLSAVRWVATAVALFIAAFMAIHGFHDLYDPERSGALAALFGFVAYSLDRRR